MAKTPKAATADDGETPKPARKARPGKPGPAAAAKPAGAGKGPRAAKAAPAPITGPVEGGVMKGKHLAERVVARSGVTRAAARPVIEAVLVELGEALARGETLVLAGLGKIKVKAAKEGAKGGATQLRLMPIGGGQKDKTAPSDDAAE